jgi:hypothetical protein
MGACCSATAAEHPGHAKSSVDIKYENAVHQLHLAIRTSSNSDLDGIIHDSDKFDDARMNEKIRERRASLPPSIHDHASLPNYIDMIEYPFAAFRPFVDHIPSIPDPQKSVIQLAGSS